VRTQATRIRLFIGDIQSAEFVTKYPGTLIFLNRMGTYSKNEHLTEGPGANAN
jgi:hypothetical protein